MLGQRSPHIEDPLGVCREMGERGASPETGAPRPSIDFESFCAAYRPGAYGRTATAPTVDRDTDELEELLTVALARMTDPAPRPVRRWPSGVEETSCGLCYERAA